jgi:DNA polymerase-3 subunit alpha (Gram-positive type)
MDIPFNDEQVMNAIKTADTMGSAEYGSKSAQEVIGLSKPANLSDLIRVSGILHGSGVWEHNADDLLQKELATLKDIISLRDDVYEFLLQHGVEKDSAYKIMEFVRKGMFYVGEGMKETEKRAEMRSQYSGILETVNVPEWYIESLKKVWYAFPKAHAVEWARRYYQLLWYQKHFPETYNQLCSDMDEE